MTINLPRSIHLGMASLLIPLTMPFPIANAAESKDDGDIETATSIEHELEQLPRAVTIEVLNARIAELQSQVDTLNYFRSLQPEPKFANRTDAAEGKDVLDGAVAKEFPLLAHVGQVELISIFDAANRPMQSRGSKATPVEGAYSEHALVGSSGSIMLWGPYAEFEPGRYLVVYHPHQFMVWSRKKNKVKPIQIDADQFRQETAISPGNIIWIPERNSPGLLK